MNLSAFDCKPFGEGLHHAKDRGNIETMIEVNMKMFQIDTAGMKEDVAFIFQAYGKFNNMFLLQTITNKETEYFIGDLDKLQEYLIERGVYANNVSYQQRLDRNLRNYFSLAN